MRVGLARPHKRINRDLCDTPISLQRELLLIPQGGYLVSRPHGLQKEYAYSFVSFIASYFNCKRTLFAVLFCFHKVTKYGK